MKGLFANRSLFFQLGVLIVGLLTGSIFGTIAIQGILLIAGDTAAAGLQHGPVWVLQATQFLSSVFLFLLPAGFTAWFCSERPKEFLHLHGFPELRLLLAVALATFLISPSISLAGYFNMQMQLPSFMAPVEAWMKASEELAADIIEHMISGKGILSFIINLVVIAVMAGITEEFLFRGALFSIFRKKIRSHHVVIWVVAVIFSAIHCQFYGFIPRMLLGAYLGYLLHWTKNIWVPVFAHFLNNAAAMTGMSDDRLKENAFFAEELAPGDLGWFSLVAGISLILFAGCILWIRRSAMRNI
ncbi:MAG: CPBP family intramembrane metalloprotease [Tannerella sp.]|jgi:membrane protease YdiL (CAAX protease family)|nr:CPBP family intramembrane metalloprotease [Tannerella sp.]